MGVCVLEGMAMKPTQSPSRRGWMLAGAGPGLGCSEVLGPVVWSCSSAAFQQLFTCCPPSLFLGQSRVGCGLLMAYLPNPSCSVVAVSKLNISNLLSRCLVSEETTSFPQSFSKIPRKAASHYLRVSAGMRLWAVAKVRNQDLSVSKNPQSLCKQPVVCVYI